MRYAGVTFAAAALRDGLSIASMDHTVMVNRPVDGKGSPRHFDAAIAALADAQHGVVSRAQLKAIGMSRDAIDGRIERGFLHPIHRGSYAVGHRRVTRDGAYMAAVLASGADAALSHRSAAALWGISPYSGRIEVTVPSPRRKDHPFIARRSSLHPDEITEERGIPVTTVARTLLDLGAVLNEDQLEKAIREAEFLRLFDLLELTARSGWTA